MVLLPFQGSDTKGHVEGSALSAERQGGGAIVSQEDWGRPELAEAETSGLRQITHYREPGPRRYFFVFPSSWWPGGRVVEGQYYRHDITRCEADRECVLQRWWLGWPMALAACGGGDKSGAAAPDTTTAAAAPAPTAGATHVINMVMEGTAYKFVPADFTIKAGDIVVFKGVVGCGAQCRVLEGQHSGRGRGRAERCDARWDRSAGHQDGGGWRLGRGVVRRSAGWACTRCTACRTWRWG